MIRNILATGTGILTYYLLLVISILLKMNIGNSPLYGAFTAYKAGEGVLFVSLLQKSLLVDVFVIYPIISAISALITGVFTRHREYLMGILTVTPYYIVLYVVPFVLTFSVHALVYLLTALFTFSTSAILGVYVSKRIRKRGDSGRDSGTSPMSRTEG